MLPYESLSDDEVKKHIAFDAGSHQQVFIAELHRRQNAQVLSELAQVKNELSNVREAVSHVQENLKTDLPSMKVELSGILRQLHHSHRVHFWILLVAILGVLLAALFAEPVWNWLKGLHDPSMVPLIRLP